MSGERITFIDNVVDPARPGRSGHSDIVWEVGRRLLGHGYRVAMVGDYTSDDVPFRHPNLTVSTFPTRAFDRQNGLGRIVHVWRAYRHAERHLETDLYFTTDAFSAGVVGFLERRTPRLFLTPANIYQRQASPYRLDPSAELFYRIVTHQAARRSDRILATSEDLKGWWVRSGAEPAKITTVPLGIEVGEFAATERRVADGPLRLLFVARFEGGNNPRMLIDLARDLEARGVDFTLTAVGDGSLHDEVVQRAAAEGVAGRIDFRGYVPYTELPAVYADHDAFVFMREAGGPPRVVIQAMASGLAVAAFDSSGIEDYLVDGESGVLVPNGDLGALATAVVAFDRDRDRLERIRRAARTRVVTKLDWDAVVREHVRVIESLLTDASAAPRSPAEAAG